ncbi:type VI secretion system baseplate subunit TssK [Dongshaea marina]|uniref:type VI secretion system baseplate subunit TssK n=1 Tax=Dongshaea marina TaxID=2047966 RepID=UPI000D3EC65D|nr:type VI secretion system baseplate subunit TssK [Dongshaea marina]
MATRIHWKEGTLLGADHFLTQDRLVASSIAEATYLPYGMSFGLSELSIDLNLLPKGEFIIDRISVYFKDRSFISLKENTLLRLSLDEKSSQTISIYLNTYQEQMTHKEIGLLKDTLFLTEKPDPISKQSIKIAEVTLAEQGWTLTPYTPPLLSCDCSIFTILLNQVTKRLISIEATLNRCHENQSLYSNLMLTCYEVSSKLQDINANPKSVHPFIIFELLKKCHLILSVSINSNEKPLNVNYNFEDSHKSFESILEKIDDLLNKPLKQQFIILKKENNAFIAEHLDRDFLNADEYLLVIKKPDLETPDLDIKDIKVSCVSRNKYINQMSLSGALLEHLPKSGLHQIRGTENHTTYRIMPGAELDYIIAEKSIMIESNESNKIYQFMIYYK